MEFYKFTKENGKKISHFNSNFILTRIIETEKKANISCMHLEENGIIGYHQAAVPQLLLVMDGEGLVRGEEEMYFPVQAGDAVFWVEGEWHETKTEKGLTAIVIECGELKPEHFMAK